MNKKQDDENMAINKHMESTNVKSQSGSKDSLSTPNMQFNRQKRSGSVGSLGSVMEEREMEFLANYNCEAKPDGSPMPPSPRPLNGSETSMSERKPETSSILRRTERYAIEPPEPSRQGEDEPSQGLDQEQSQGGLEKLPIEAPEEKYTMEYSITGHRLDVNNVGDVDAKYVWDVPRKQKVAYTRARSNSASLIRWTL